MPLLKRSEKVAASDFRPENLPPNRVALFFDVLGTRFWKLVTANLLFMLFTLPIWVWTYYNISAMAADLEHVSSYIFPWLVGMIPAMTLAGAPVMGLTYLLRNWARGDHAFVWMDFKDSMKENWKLGTVLMLINSLAMLALFVANNFYTIQYAEEGNILYQLLQYLLWMVGILFLMLNTIVCPILVTYDMKLGTAMKNSLVIAVARLPMSILMLLIEAVILIGVFLIHPIVGVLFVIFLGPALIGLISASYSNSCMDRYINTYVEGADVNKGMYIDDEDEDGDENGDDDEDDMQNPSELTDGEDQNTRGGEKNAVRKSYPKGKSSKKKR